MDSLLCSKLCQSQDYLCSDWPIRVGVGMEQISWNRTSQIKVRARIFKRLWSPGIDSKASIPPAYVAWRAGTITLFLLGS